jgi:hypothetical protein
MAALGTSTNAENFSQGDQGPLSAGKMNFDSLGCVPMRDRACYKRFPVWKRKSSFTSLQKELLLSSAFLNHRNKDSEPEREACQKSPV